MSATRGDNSIKQVKIKGWRDRRVREREWEGERKGEGERGEIGREGGREEGGGRGENGEREKAENGGRE